MTAAMGRSAAEVELAMPRAQAWAKLRDLMLSQDYVPGVERIEITTRQREGVGASRRVFCKGRPPVDETVVLWDEGHGFTVRLHKGDEPPAPFKQAQFVYRLDDAPDGRTRVTTTLAYELPFGVLGRLLDALLMRRVSQAMVKAIASGLKQVYETGKRANA
jgi:hypothetical protein